MNSSVVDVKHLVLPDTGFLRLPEVLKFIPVKKTRWWDGIKKGEFPKGIKLSERVTVWRAEDIRALIQKIGQEAA